ncbi:MAG: 4-hydroxythreonine-4-phosphate dehydrogenase PdxA [Elusimicrobia bacterium]|jgi:4-hydroxythreonine-4-phosphate dehydrogenase|nr:4-hydroxythreonine-4-phosphate dehydrogenase PdxA [Elusimicrobiota bacterium]MBK7207058.1 4-hydroxythreonine-4-phosphate dehydrogenase PdxA [Elusimicrobiota bacterium]MBK7545878.1 4-hydroxythreonine-4-phosphate dehydrogenase PdxA [Elusimicrobiota bacterium]MBK7575142.1 4-hydroxythreonine-4-phosphate dehydrogenase PdxA [Elusimicrobiota bacterium]MBK7687594.1 4-hydroxythreonine-4-phosphate dehydrogenase PdxA [Elusimicrobiota bacterium]
MNRPLLAFTLGDPAGCGPWVSVRAALDPDVRRAARPLLIGDAWVVHRHVRFPRVSVKPLMELSDYVDRPGVVNVLHVPHPEITALVLGAPQRIGGESAALSIRTAVGLALSGRVAGVVTGPVSKESLNAAGLPFPGHTEMLRALAGSGPVEMVMGAPGPRGRRLLTVLITRHLPLARVPGALTEKVIVDSVRRVDGWARREAGIRAPRWVLAGLNPHAGDNGLIGREEIRVIRPAAAALRRAGIRVEGPLPADTAWARHAAGEFDLVGSLYHDQGMIPLKMAAPRAVVNITAGLPFVRTSPGHGTAFDLSKGARPYAGADPSATIQAARWALALKGMN